MQVGEWGNSLAIRNPFRPGWPPCRTWSPFPARRVGPAPLRRRPHLAHGPAGRPARARRRRTHRQAGSTRRPRRPSRPPRRRTGHPPDLPVGLARLRGVMPQPRPRVACRPRHRGRARRRSVDRGPDRAGGASGIVVTRAVVMDLHGRARPERHGGGLRLRAGVGRVRGRRVRRRVVRRGGPGIRPHRAAMRPPWRLFDPRQADAHDPQAARSAATKRRAGPLASPRAAGCGRQHAPRVAGRGGAARARARRLGRSHGRAAEPSKAAPRCLDRGGVAPARQRDCAPRRKHHISRSIQPVTEEWVGAHPSSCRARRPRTRLLEPKE